MPKRRRQKRQHFALPVKVCLPGISNLKLQPACTLDLAHGGVRLSGFRFDVSTGMVIALERAKQRVNFKVAWVGRAGSKCEGQVGLQCLDPIEELWGVELIQGEGELIDVPEEAMSSNNHHPAGHAAMAAHAGDQHSAPVEPYSLGPRIALAAPTLGIARYACSGDLEWRPEGAEEEGFKGRLREVGPRGCFAVTSARLPVGTRVRLVLKAVGHIVHARATVRNTDEHGMWMEFFDLHPEEMQSLLFLIDHIAS